MFGASRRELLRMLDRERQRNERREAELLDRIMLLANRPWNLPPAAMADLTPEEPEQEFVSALDLMPEEFGEFDG
jgi:hypothetical protein